MAWVRVQGNLSTQTSSAATTKSVTLGVAVGSGNSVLGLVTWDGTGSVALTSVTDDKGNTYNLETVVTDPAPGRVCAFSRTNITNAPTIITANFASSVGYLSILADEFSGGSTATTDERDGTAHTGQYQGAPGTGTNAITSGSVTTATNGDLIYGAVSVSTSITPPSVGTGFTIGNSSSYPDYAIASEYRIQTTAGSGTAATFTQAGNENNSTFVIALKSGGTIPNKIYQTNFAIKRASYY